MTALDLAAVLREHDDTIDSDDESIRAACKCGAVHVIWIGLGAPPIGHQFYLDSIDSHRAHVADRLNAATVEWLESEGARNIAVTQLLNEGAGAGSSIHSWRCDYPDRYGDCTCVQETAMETLSALAAQIGSES